VILTCPDCGGFDDRPDDLCGMCWETTVGTAEVCLHTRLEKYNAGCECDGEQCPDCGAEMDADGCCWRCESEDHEDRLNARSGLL
jgi:hypothetical protein